MNIRVIDYTLLIFPALLLFITFCKSVSYFRTNSSENFSPSMWDLSQAKMLEAVACIGVILHHLTQHISSYGSINRGPITILSSMGILFTSVFFFFTGYGLIVSVMTNPNYLDTFLRHRLSKVLIPFLTANILCVLVRVFYNCIPTMPVDVFRAIFGLVLLNGNGWYIVEVFFLYIAFYILFRLIKNKDLAIILLCFFTIMMILYSYGLGHDHSDIGDRPFYGEWWYNSTIVFIMGVIFARFRCSIVPFLKKFYRFMLPVVSVSFIIAFVIEEHILKTHGYYHESITIDRISSAFITLIAQMVLCVLFVFLVLLINMKIKIENRILKGISTISMELFLIHGLFLYNVFNFTYINDFLMYIIVFVCSIPAAIIMHFINTPLCTFFGTKEIEKKTYTKEEYAERVRQASIRKEAKKSVIVTFSVIVVSVLIVSLLYFFKLRPLMEYKSELRSLREAECGEVVHFGRYDMSYSASGKERVSWIVLNKEDKKVMLISKEGLSGCAYYKKHAESDWESSYIRSYLNSDLYNDLFSKYEKNIIVCNSPSNGESASLSDDFVTLLTVDEAYTYFKDDVDRQLIITEAARKSGTNINTFSKDNYWDMVDYNTSWWWLKGEKKDITAPIVTVDGNILKDSKYVNKPTGAVRPVIWVSLDN